MVPIGAVAGLINLYSMIEYTKSRKQLSHRKNLLYDTVCTLYLPYMHKSQKVANQVGEKSYSDIFAHILFYPAIVSPEGPEVKTLKKFVSFLAHSIVSFYLPGL